MDSFKNITADSIANAHRPFDIVRDSFGNVGFIKEVSFNDSQLKEQHQIQYSVHWLIEIEPNLPELHTYKSAWFHREELTAHANILMEIARCAGSTERVINQLF